MSTGQALDVALDASAQLGLGCRRVVPEGLAEGQQLSFQGQLGGAPPLGPGDECRLDIASVLNILWTASAHLASGAASG